jgi:hypothetical protein
MYPPTSASAMHNARLPDALVWAIVTVCVLPFLLSLAGVDFSTQVCVFNVESGCTPYTMRIRETNALITPDSLPIW